LPRAPHGDALRGEVVAASPGDEVGLGDHVGGYFAVADTTQHEGQHVGVVVRPERPETLPVG
jgi:hypothetical protein